MLPLQYTQSLASKAIKSLEQKNRIALKKIYSELFKAIVVYEFKNTPELGIEFILNDGKNDLDFEKKAKKNPTSYKCPKEFLADAEVGFVSKVVPRGGLEPPTQGFSVLCSTN
jgi:hypothetical protein